MERTVGKVHVVEYMDLNANKKRELKTIDDYRKIASSCFNNADSFLRLACYPMICRNTEDILSPSVFATESFASELYLKTMLYLQHAAQRDLRNHSLDALFEMLDKDVQASIIESFLQNGRSDIRDREEFLTSIHEIRDAFAILRHHHELDGYVFPLEFSFNLAITLREEARERLTAHGCEKTEEIIRIAF